MSQSNAYTVYKLWMSTHQCFSWPCSHWLNYHSTILYYSHTDLWVTECAPCFISHSGPFLSCVFILWDNPASQACLVKRQHESTEARAGVNTRQNRLPPQLNLLQFLSAASDCLFHSAIAWGGILLLCLLPCPNLTHCQDVWFILVWLRERGCTSGGAHAKTTCSILTIHYLAVY